MVFENSKLEISREIQARIDQRPKCNERILARCSLPSQRWPIQLAVANLFLVVLAGIIWKLSRSLFISISHRGICPFSERSYRLQSCSSCLEPINLLWYSFHYHLQHFCLADPPRASLSCLFEIARTSSFTSVLIRIFLRSKIRKTCIANSDSRPVISLKRQGVGFLARKRKM